MFVLWHIVLETKRVPTNAIPLKLQGKFQQSTLFVHEGKQVASLLLPNSIPLHGARDWEMHADSGKCLIAPPEIAATNLRLDLVLWLKSCQRAFRSLFVGNYNLHVTYLVKCIPGLIAQYNCPTSLVFLWLNGSKYLSSISMRLGGRTLLVM